MREKPGTAARPATTNCGEAGEDGASGVMENDPNEFDEQHNEPERDEPERDGGEAEGAEPERKREAAAEGETEEEPPPLARVRYGLAKELRLYPDSIVVEFKEEHEETRFTLDNIKRIVLTPGEYNPAKLVLLFDLDDGNTVIAAEGMTNVKDFRKLLRELREIRPQMQLEPPDMDTQLQQALEIRRRSLLGCYGGFAGICVALWIIYLVVAYVGAHAH